MKPRMATFLKPQHDYAPKRPMATRHSDRTLIWAMAGCMILYVVIA